MRKTGLVGWLISLTGTGLWSYAYFVTGHPPFIDWHANTPWGITDLLPNAESEIGMARPPSLAWSRSTGRRRANEVSAVLNYFGRRPIMPAVLKPALKERLPQRCCGREGPKLQFPVRGCFQG